MTQKRYIQLPHEYLSYSQYTLWKSSPKRYADLYFDKRHELRYTNPGQSYGKIVADSLESEVETGDLLTDAATLLFPKYDVRDVEQHIELKTKHGWLKLIGKPDTFDSLTHAFREYKTGKVPWTPKKAQNHVQMIFYAVIIWLLTGTQNERAFLDWMETERVENEHGVLITKPTGRIESYEVTFTKPQYLEFLADLIRVAREIEVAWASHVTDPELVNF